jgi:DNA-binding NtrC family response regulator
LAATNRNLEQLLKENRFREDLFYRLNVIPLNDPSLRDRREDIVPIAKHMLKQIASERGWPEIWLAPRAQDALTNYDWPGNARELLNLLERLVFYQEKQTIWLQDLPVHLRKPRKGAAPAPYYSLKHVQDMSEKETIRNALESVNYNKARASALLGIHRSLLYKKIHKYGLALRPE